MCSEFDLGYVKTLNVTEVNVGYSRKVLNVDVNEENKRLRG